MPLIDFAIAAIELAVIGVLVSVVHTCGVAHIGAPSVITNAVRQGVVPVEIDVTRTVLHGNKHSVVVLRTAIDNKAKPSDFASIGWIQER